MKNKKITLLTSIILTLIVISVYLVGLRGQDSVTISASGEYSAIYKGDDSVNGVALMFNVYENTDIVNEIITLLKKENVVATFFVGGCWADDNEKTLKTIIDSGFELANHGYFHKDHKNLSKEQNIREIQDCFNIVYSLTGYKMKLFAPPSGSYSNQTLKVASELGFHTIMWSKDTIDWRDNDVSLIVKRATENVKSGDLILMHPKQHTLEALSTIIKEIKNKNLKLLTVSECCSLQPLKV